MLKKTPNPLPDQNSDLPNANDNDFQNNSNRVDAGTNQSTRGNADELKGKQAYLTDKKEEVDKSEPESLVRCELFFHMNNGSWHSNILNITPSNLAKVRENILKGMESKPENGLLILTGTENDSHEFCILPHRNIHFISAHILPPKEQPKPLYPIVKECDDHYQSLFQSIKNKFRKKPKKRKRTNPLP